MESSSVPPLSPLASMGGLANAPLIDPPFTGDEEALQSPVMGGFTFGFGMRAVGFLRGPEIRLSLIGGDADGDWFAAPGAPGSPRGRSRGDPASADPAAG